MKTLYSLNQELKKTILNYGFLACVLISFGLYLTASIYYEESTGRWYSTIEALLTLEPEVLRAEISCSRISVFTVAMSDYFTMFIPIIAAFPFIPNFCAERNSGLIRFSITRTGKYRYYVCKFIAAFLGGGLAVLIAYIIYGIFVFFTFPSMSSYADCYYTHGQAFDVIIKSVTGAFLYGGISAVPAFLIAAFVKNRYLITCIPFMIIYLYTSVLTKIRYDAIQMMKSEESYNKIQALFPDNITQLAFFTDSVKYSIIIQGIFIVLACGTFILIMSKRRDLGE